MLAALQYIIIYNIIHVHIGGVYCTLQRCIIIYLLWNNVHSFFPAVEPVLRVRARERYNNNIIILCVQSRILFDIFFSIIYGAHFLPRQHCIMRGTRTISLVGIWGSRDLLLSRRQQRWWHVFGPCQKDRNERELRPPIIACMRMYLLVHCVRGRPHRLHDLDLFGDKNGMPFFFSTSRLQIYIHRHIQHTNIYTYRHTHRHIHICSRERLCLLVPFLSHISDKLVHDTMFMRDLERVSPTLQRRKNKP